MIVCKPCVKSMPSRLPNIYMLDASPHQIKRVTMIPYDSIKLRFRQTPTQELFTLCRAPATSLG